ncbi:MAG: hypothetical protein PUE63_10690 [Lachnospiraceae bacterium]|jgi:hypothetical protein|nr:hypothetical protein [Lachnospiraceae bacterium]
MRAYSKYITLVVSAVLFGVAMFAGELVLISLFSLNPILVSYLVAGAAGCVALTLNHFRLMPVQNGRKARM